MAETSARQFFRFSFGSFSVFRSAVWLIRSNISPNPVGWPGSTSRFLPVIRVVFAFGLSPREYRLQFPSRSAAEIRCAFFIRYGGKNRDALKVKRNDSNSLSRPTNISRLF